MLKLPIYFFCSLILLHFQGQLADTLQNGTSVSVLQITHKGQNQINTIEGELQTLRRSVKEELDAFQSKIDIQLERVRSEMNAQFHAILSKMDGLQAVPQETHISNNSAGTPITEKSTAKTPMKPTNENQTISAHFEQIGSRFFYIENETKVKWSQAESTCREKGGYLATIKDRKEYDAITAKLKEDRNYWLGINDLLKEGNYASIASGKEAMYLRWAGNNPYNGGRRDYVSVRNGYMYNRFEYFLAYFICQADSEF